MSTGRTLDPGTAAVLERIRTHMWVPQVCVGLALLLFGYWLGREHLTLIRNGASSQGRIVAFESVRMRDSRRSSFTTTAQMPIVEYHLGDHDVRFRDWLAGRPGEYKGSVVPVLYDPSRPSVAMIDRPVWNWIPWGPTAAVGLLVMVSGGVARVRGLRGGG